MYHGPASYSTKFCRLNTSLIPKWFLHYQLHKMRRQNETCPEIERLKDGEFTLDLEEQRKQEALVEQEVIQVRADADEDAKTKIVLTEMSS